MQDMQVTYGSIALWNFCFLSNHFYRAENGTLGWEANCEFGFAEVSSFTIIVAGVWCLCGAAFTRKCHWEFQMGGTCPCFLIGITLQNK